MIDILVYLFETYGYAESCPEPDQLARRLSAVGFEEEEIDEAMEWFAGLRRIEDNAVLTKLPSKDAIRVYSPQEDARLDAECKGFLLFLEDAGLLDSQSREIVIERAMALPEGEINLSKFKITALMVLWQQKADVDALILGELLTVDEDDEEWDDEGVLLLH